MMLNQAAMSKVSNHRVACVTGGAKRIGRALVLALHQANYNIIIHYQITVMPFAHNQQKAYKGI